MKDKGLGFFSPRQEYRARLVWDEVEAVPWQQQARLQAS